jgi:hypothetical protein
MGAMETAMDQGMPANYHLEAQITANTNGSVIMNETPPTIRITDKSTGQFRDLPAVMGMYGAQQGMSDFHYGQNVYLPAGSYTVDVSLGTDIAHFNDVSVSGGMPMASMGMGMGAPSGQSTSAGMGMGNTSMNPDVASDGATLAGQPADVQSMFNAIWGARAAAEWATEHTASLGMH